MAKYKFDMERTTLSTQFVDKLIVGYMDMVQYKECLHQSSVKSV